MTFKQIEKLGGHVNQGEESKVVVFWKMLRITETDDAGEEREKTIPFLAHYHVFHIDQTTGITPLTQEEQNAILQPNETAENVISDYIEMNYSKQIELSQLAEINGISEEHLCRIFKLYTGMRPFEYIKNLRIQRAKEYLYEHNDMKISEISKITGFQSASYFCMVFKKSVGVTPEEYRKLYG